MLSDLETMQSQEDFLTAQPAKRKRRQNHPPTNQPSLPSIIKNKQMIAPTTPTPNAIANQNNTMASSSASTTKHLSNNKKRPAQDDDDDDDDDEDDDDDDDDDDDEEEEEEEEDDDDDDANDDDHDDHPTSKIKKRKITHKKQTNNPPHSQIASRKKLNFQSPTNKQNKYKNRQSQQPIQIITSGIEFSPSLYQYNNYYNL